MESKLAKLLELKLEEMQARKLALSMLTKFLWRYQERR